MIRIGLCAALFGGGFLPYIEALYPLQNVLSESDVVVGVVERNDGASKTCIVRVTKALKGKPPCTHVRMNLSRGAEWEREAALRHLVVGAPVVIFDGIRTGQVAPTPGKRKALIYASRFFMKFSGDREASPEKEVWSFEQIEIMLNRTFNGPADELSALVTGSLTGKQKAPPPDARIPHIKKEDVEVLPLPGVKVADAKLPAPFRRGGAVALRAPENPAKVVPGLRFEYYEGSWKDVPDFSTLPPVLKGAATSFEPPERRRAQGVGLRFTGYLEVPRDGTYVFSATSPAAHRVWFGKSELVLIVQKHSVDAAIDLKAGRHAFSVAFVDGGSGGNLKLTWEGPGVSKQPVPASAFTYAPQAR